MTQTTLRSCVRQEQPAQTSTRIGGVQTHAAVATAPRTGMFNKLMSVSLYPEHMLRRYSWLNTDRPVYYHLLKMGLQPYSLADEDKCRRLIVEPKAPIARPGNMTVKFVSERDYVPVTFSFQNEGSFHALQSLDDDCDDEVDFTTQHPVVKRDSCRRKKRKHTGTDHLKDKIVRKTCIQTRGGGNKGRISYRGLSAPIIPRKTKAVGVQKSESEPLRPSCVPVRQQMMGGNPAPQVLLHPLLVADGVNWRAWKNRPFSCCVAMLSDFSDRVLQNRNAGYETLFGDIHRAIRAYREVSLSQDCLGNADPWRERVIDKIVREISMILIGNGVEDELINRVLEFYHNMEPVYEELDKLLYTPAEKIPSLPGLLGNAWGSLSVFGLGRSHIDSWVVRFLFPRLRIDPWNPAAVNFRQFIPVGTPENWKKGGSVNLFMRAIAWSCTDFAAIPPVTNWRLVGEIVRTRPGLIPAMVRRALAGAFDAPDVNAWLEEFAYQRTNEYTTILENVLQRPIPFWGDIEPFLWSFSSGYMLFSTMLESSVKSRITAALGVMISVYSQHALASRSFIRMLKDTASLLYKSVYRVVQIAEEMWRKMNAPRQQSLLDDLDPIAWFTRFCSFVDSEFSKKLLQAIAMVGAVVTCPWKNLSEGSISEWSDKALSYLATTSKTIGNKFGFLENVFSLFKFFFLQARLAWINKDFGLFFYGRDEFNEYLSQVNTLVEATKMLSYMSTTWSSSIVNGVPYNIESYAKLIASLDAINKQIDKDLRDRKIISLPISVSAARSRFATCVATYEVFKKNQKNRPLPFVIPIIGPPAAGKNTVLEEIVEKIFATCKFPVSVYELVDGVPTFSRMEYKKLEPCVWTSNAFDDYASGFTNSHNVVNFIEPTLARNSTPEGVKHGFSQLAQFFSFVDTAPYQPVMAAVEDKGKMSANGVLLATVSANDAEFNKWMLTCEMALFRRLGFLIVMRPIEAYEDPMTSGLDRNKIPDSHFKTDEDMWTFHVKKPASQGRWDEKNAGGHAEWITDDSAGDGGVFYTVQDLMRWLVDRLNRHFVQQFKVMCKGENVRGVECCSVCFRSGHSASAHHTGCGSVLCRDNLCVRIVNECTQLSAMDCPLCGGDRESGCTGCFEKKLILAAAEMGNKTRSAAIADGAEEWPTKELPSHCSRCYSMSVAPIMGTHKCYVCDNAEPVNHHLRSAFISGFSSDDSTRDIALSSDIEFFLRNRDGGRWCDTHFRACGKCNASRFGVIQQMGQFNISDITSREIALTGLGVVAGSALVYSLLGRKAALRIEHHVVVNTPDLLPVSRAVGSTVDSIRSIFRLPGISGIDYPKPLDMISEENWFNWAQGKALSLFESIGALSLKDWMTFVGLIGLITSCYAAFQGVKALVYPRDVSTDSSTKTSTLIEAVRGAVVQQSGMLDVGFLKHVLAQFKLSTGARASVASGKKVDNPWLNSVFPLEKTCLGKRGHQLGEQQCKQATDRIGKSIYKFVSIAKKEGDTVLSRSLHSHGLLLAGSDFIVNAHFILGAFARQISLLFKGYKLGSSSVDKHLIGHIDENSVYDNIMKATSWDEAVKYIKLYGSVVPQAESIWLRYCARVESGALGGDPGSGVTSEVEDFVNIDRIAGCIYSDVCVVRMYRVAPRQGAGLVYNIEDLNRGVLLPRAHTAPTHAVLYPNSNTWDDQSISVAVYGPEMSSDLQDPLGTRHVEYDAWSLKVRYGTSDGDCGLPLIGVFHTKYVDDPIRGSKIPDASGDTVGILGMHRLYNEQLGIVHCAPLSIDLISGLLGSLDQLCSSNNIAVQQSGGYPVHSLRQFGCGKVPTTVPIVKGPLLEDSALDIDRITNTDKKSIIFKHGSSNVYHDKSPLQWMGCGEYLDYAADLGEAYALHGEAVGSTFGFRQGNFTSSVTRLPLANYFNFEQKHVAPKLNDRRGKECNLVAMSGATNGDLNIPLLSKIKSDFVQDILGKLDKTNPEWRSAVHPLSDQESITGSSIANFTPGINRSTGMGFPIYGSKESHVCIERDNHGEVINCFVRDEVLHEVKNMVEAYANLERANPVFTATPKDERLGASKIKPIFDINRNRIGEAHDIRIFLCGSYPFVHLQRQQYLSVIRLICEYPEIFGMAVGTNVASPRWGLMRDWLTWGGLANDTILAGDYSKFDKRMTCTWILVAFEILLSIMDESRNYHEGDIRIAEGIAWDTAIPLIDWFGDWFFITNGHPSGHALTTIINGIVNQLYLRYSYYVLWGKWYRLSPLSCSGMNMCVRTYTYGDDNISGVIGDAKKFFTMPRICAELLKVGVILTTEDKTAVVDDFTSISRASFLKRTWVDSNDMVLAPLARKSIEAMVTIGVLNTKDTITQVYQILRSFLDEHFHYGESCYNDCRERVISCCMDDQYWVKEGFPLVGLALKRQWESMGDKMFPPHDVLVQRWRKADYVQIC